MDSIVSPFLNFYSQASCLAFWTVNELIDPISRSWKLDQVSSLLSESKVNIIQAIPLSFHRTADMLTCHYEKNGRFMVRSVYHLMREWLYPSRLRSSSFSSNSNRRSIFGPRFGVPMCL